MSGNNLRKLFGTDNKAETEGIWIDYADGIAMKIARMGGANTEYSRYLAEQLKPYKFQFERGMLPEEKLKDVVIDVFSRHILRNWKGLTDDKGNSVEYSIDAAKEVLTEYPELFNDLQQVAADYKRFTHEALEEAAKN